jgi:hypothetical protein
MNKNNQALAALVGGMVGLGFYFAFWLLGYSFLFRLFAATVAAIAGGWIVFWWHSEEPVKKNKPKKINLSTKLRFSRRPRVAEAQRGLVEMRNRRFPRRTEEQEQKAKV